MLDLIVVKNNFTRLVKARSGMEIYHKANLLLSIISKEITQMHIVCYNT